MRRLPRDPREPLFRAATVVRALLQGAIALAVTCVVLAYAMRNGDDGRARALAFTAIVLANLGLILALRSVSVGGLRALRVPNPALGWVVTGALVALGASLAAPPLREVLHFAAPSPRDSASSLPRRGWRC